MGTKCAVGGRSLEEREKTGSREESGEVAVTETNAQSQSGFQVLRHIHALKSKSSRWNSDPRTSGPICKMGQGSRGQET